jgi:protein SCO1/2
MQRSRRRFVLPLAVLAIGIVGIATAAYVMRPGAVRPPGSFIGGPFTLTGQDGRTMTERDLIGHPTLVFFGYTHCPDVCPTDLFEMSEVFKALGPKANIKAFFVTVDPERDTPAVMKDYTSNFDPRIVGLSGDAAQTAAIEKAYRVYAKKAPAEHGEYLMDHSAIVYLMNKQGRFVNAFNLDRPPQEAAQELSGYL